MRALFGASLYPNSNKDVIKHTIQDTYPPPLTICQTIMRLICVQVARWVIIHTLISNWVRSVRA